MDFIPQYLFNGLVVGCSYALIAVGLTAIFGLMEIANFAHGQFYMLGAYFSYWLTRIVGLDFWTGLVASIVGVMLLGVILERTLFRLLRGASLSSSVLATIALSIFLENLALNVWGPRPQKILSPFETGGIEFLGIFTTPDRLLMLFVTVLVVILLHVGLRHTQTGKAIRATFQQREAAALVGIDINRLYTLTFAIGAGLAGLAGVLLGTIFVVQPSMGGVATLKAFVVVTLGGISSFAGGIAGGLVLGLAESLGAIIAPAYKDAVGFILVMLVLLYKPDGLFGKKLS
jgi:branched-chain amino acid transport system permease protein